MRKRYYPFNIKILVKMENNQESLFKCFFIVLILEQILVGKFYIIDWICEVNNSIEGQKI